jgi:hypothetical protein
MEVEKKRKREEKEEEKKAKRAAKEKKTTKASKKKEERLLLWKEATKKFHAETHRGLKHRKYQHYYVDGNGASIGKADEEGHLTLVWWLKCSSSDQVDYIAPDLA